MTPLVDLDLAHVRGGNALGEVWRDLAPAADVQLDQTYDYTQSFMKHHASFFRRGMMNLPIGGGKRVRNLPSVGAGNMVRGLATADPVLALRGWTQTAAQWEAP